MSALVLLNEVWTVTWGPKGDHFVTSGKDGRVIRWEVQFDQNHQIQKIHQHSFRFDHSVVSHSISPDGLYVHFLDFILFVQKGYCS